MFNHIFLPIKGLLLFLPNEEKKGNPGSQGRALRPAGPSTPDRKELCLQISAHLCFIHNMQTLFTEPQTDGAPVLPALVYISRHVQIYHGGFSRVRLPVHAADREDFK